MQEVQGAKCAFAFMFLHLDLGGLDQGFWSLSFNGAFHTGVSILCATHVWMQIRNFLEITVVYLERVISSSMKYSAVSIIDRQVMLVCE